MSDLIKEIENEYKEAVNKLPDFKAGDTVNVHVKIKEGEFFTYNPKFVKNKNKKNDKKLIKNNPFGKLSELRFR